MGSPRTQCREPGYFQLLHDPEAEADFESNLNKKYESQAHEFIPCLESKLCYIPPGKKLVLARYIAVLFSRSMARKHAIAFFSKQIKSEFIAAISNPAKVVKFAKEIRRHFGGWIGMPEIMSALEKHADQFDSPHRDQELFVNNLFGLLPTTEQQLLNRHWRILEAPPDEEFVLSDTPVLTRFRFPDRHYGYGWGLAHNNTEVLLSVSPRTCLCIGMPGSERETIKQEELRQINEYAVRFSVKKVFSSKYMEDVDHSVQRFSNSLRLGEKPF